MSNVTDGVLPDVRKFNLADLDGDSTALSRALERFLSPNGECGFSSFNSSICESVRSTETTAVTRVPSGSWDDSHVPEFWRAVA